jgi:hypothetical protein
MAHLRRREEGAYLLTLSRDCTEIALKSWRNICVKPVKPRKHKGLADTVVRRHTCVSDWPQSKLYEQNEEILLPSGEGAGRRMRVRHRINVDPDSNPHSGALRQPRSEEFEDRLFSRWEKGRSCQSSSQIKGAEMKTAIGVPVPMAA